MYRLLTDTKKKKNKTLFALEGSCDLTLSHMNTWFQESNFSLNSAFYSNISPFQLLFWTNIGLEQ